MKLDTKSIILGVLIGLIISFLFLGEVYVDVRIGDEVKEDKTISI